MANSRETIVSRVYDLLVAQRSVKLGKVERDPINPTELPKTAFPAVYIETTNEDIFRLTKYTYNSELEIAIVIMVGGVQRDTQRNTVISAIESTLMGDQTLAGLVNDVRFTRVESITTGESAPFASCRMIVQIDYCYSI